VHILKNKHIKLRALEPTDLDALFEIENDSAMWNISDTLVPYSRDLLSKYIEESTKDIFEAKQVRLAISPNGSDELIGLIDLFQFEPHHRRAGMGIFVRKDHQQKGIATQAVDLMTHYAFHILGLNQVFAHVPMNNHGSQRLFENSGFAISGTLKDWMKDENGYTDVLIYQLMNPENAKMKQEQK
jgi:diamine N-acetyltransferase